MDLSLGVAGKRVLIVEDIIDSGYTLSKVVEVLQTRNPQDVRICTLLDKHARRKVEMKVDYVDSRSKTNSCLDTGWTWTRSSGTCLYRRRGPGQTAARTRMNSMIPRVPIRPLIWPDTILELAEQLTDSDQPIYIVGGAVRDAYFGLPLHDCDLVTPVGAAALARKSPICSRAMCM